MKFINYSVLFFCCLFYAYSAKAEKTREPDMRQKIVLDYSAAEAALDYFAGPSELKLAELVRHPAYRLILEHSERYSSRPLTESDLIRAFKDESPELGLTDAARRLPELKRTLHYLKTNEPSIRKEFLVPHLRYLPGDYSQPATIYFALGGYNGIALDGQAAMNINDKQFLNDTREMLLYLPHELFHLGFAHYQKPTDLGAMKTVKDLKDVVMSFTMNEGLATLVPYAKRKQLGALSDPDYAALENKELLEKKIRTFNALMAELDGHAEEPVTPEFLNRILGQCSRERLFYVVGCHMGLAIENRYGRTALIDLLKSPPAEFFSAFKRSQNL